MDLDQVLPVINLVVFGVSCWHIGWARALDLDPRMWLASLLGAVISASIVLLSLGG